MYVRRLEEMVVEDLLFLSVFAVLFSIVPQ